jgi:hypothetical protein
MSRDEPWLTSSSQETDYVLKAKEVMESGCTGADLVS